MALEKGHDGTMWEWMAGPPLGVMGCKSVGLRSAWDGAAVVPRALRAGLLTAPPQAVGSHCRSSGRRVS